LGLQRVFFSLKTAASAGEIVMSRRKMASSAIPVDPHPKAPNIILEDLEGQGEALSALLGKEKNVPLASALLIPGTALDSREEGQSWDKLIMACHLPFDLQSRSL
jgi:hypothetical protein